jgi:hypothetical protein
MSLRQRLLLSLALLLSVTCAVAQDRPQRIENAKEGEICQVCNNRVSGKDACYLADGQRIVLHSEECQAAFLEHPGKYLATIRPNQILFSVWSRSGLSANWFWAGLYVLAGLLFGGLCAHRAIGTGRNALAWFLIGFFLLLAGYALALFAKPRSAVQVPSGLGKVAATSAPVSCPRCGTGNHPSARNCSSCGGELNPLAPSEVSAAFGT